MFYPKTVSFCSLSDRLFPMIICVCIRVNYFLCGGYAMLYSNHHFGINESIYLFVYVHSRSAVSDSCDPMDCSPPGSSVHGISQVRILEWVAMSFYRGSSLPRDQTQVSCGFRIGRGILYHQATREAHILLYQFRKKYILKCKYFNKIEIILGILFYYLTFKNFTIY